MKYILLLFPIYLLASQVTLDERISTLENEIAQMKKSDRQNSLDTEENMQILEKVETKSILDKINFTPELLLRVDKFHYNNKKIDTENTLVYNPDGTPTTIQRRDEFTKDYKPASFMRFRLNMNMELGNIKFHGRLVNINSSQSDQRLCILSYDIKSGLASSAFDVDRAYIDYAINSVFGDKFTFSFGILPTTNGTPMQYADNRARSSMFPALVFDMNTYGLIGTQKFSHDLYVRLILAQAYSLRTNFYPYQCNRENIDNANIIGLYADKKIRLLQSDSLISFGVNVLNDLKAHPYLGPDVDSSHSKHLGIMITIGAGIDMPHVMHSNTTLFLHTALSNPHGNGNKEDYKIDNNATSEPVNGTPGFTTADYASGGMLSQNGYALYIGSKYDYSKSISLGLEYNHGSKYWFSATQGAEDIFNKLATRGDVFEFYSLWQLNRYINVKASILSIKENYTGSGWHFGEPVKKDARQSIASLSIEARF